MRTLFLHIGTPKTGTSALQWFFFHNRPRLKELGITYPDFGIVDDCHHRIGASFHHPDVRPAYIQYKDMLTLEEYAEMLKAIEGDVLISSELISHGYLASKLREAIGDVDIRVVVYLRRQDSFLESWYNQEVKLLSGEGIREFYERAGGLLDYRLGILEGWAAVWGVENVVVRAYEKKRFAAQHICDDFVEHVFGWKRPEDFAMPPSDVNPGLSADALEYKRAVNTLPLSDEVKCLLATTMATYSCVEDSGQPSSRSVMPHSLRKEILERYRESNAWVARTFMGREDGCLFAEPDWKADDDGAHRLSRDTVLAISRFIERDMPNLYAPLCVAIVEGLRAKQDTVREAAELLAARIP
jgi:hypothetical protein